MNKNLKSKSKITKVVIDTDTYNEIDDQFALIYALKSKKQISVEAIYAAPFYGDHKIDKASSPKEGMEKSYNEINNILDLLKMREDIPVYKGSTDYLKDLNTPEKSEAVLNLIERAKGYSKDSPLFVIAIGAITNIISAILIEPTIIDKINVIWLGGNPHYWKKTDEFNLRQDILASQYLFDCNVPLVQIPCIGVASHLMTSEAELKKYLNLKSDVGSYLYKLFLNRSDDRYAYTKPLWDISAVAYIINHNWFHTYTVHRPIVTSQCTWSFDPSRNFMKVVNWIERDLIFEDFFTKLSLN